MAWFKRKEKILDLTDKYHRQKQKDSAEALKKRHSENSIVSNENSNDSGFPSFLGGLANAATQQESNSEKNSSEYIDLSNGGSGEDKKRKLAKRLMSMTEKIEDLSNQIYHLQQRVELLERKSKIN